MSRSPLRVTLETNPFYDKAEGRQGSCDFDAIVDLARSRQIELFFTATTDFEDESGDAMRLALDLKSEGILREAPNAGTPADFMPGGPGLHLPDESERDRLFRCIWPTLIWSAASENQRNDVYHLLVHRLNRHDIFITRDNEILDRRQQLRDGFEITVMRPAEFLKVVGGD